MKHMMMLFLACLSSGFLMAQTQEKDINKMAEFKNANYDFGKIQYGVAVEFDVEIKNISNETITLENVTVGCGCTTPKYEKGKKIAPGETVKVTLGFDGKTVGPFTKFADLYFNDGMHKQVKFIGESRQ